MTCTFVEFKGRCKELIDAAPDLDGDQLANGVKMLNISYLTLQANDLDQYQASIALQLTLKQVGALELNL